VEQLFHVGLFPLSEDWGILHEFTGNFKFLDLFKFDVYRVFSLPGIQLQIVHPLIFLPLINIKQNTSIIASRGQKAGISIQFIARFFKIGGKGLKIGENLPIYDNIGLIPIREEAHQLVQKALLAILDILGVHLVMPVTLVHDVYFLKVILGFLSPFFLLFFNFGQFVQFKLDYFRIVGSLAQFDVANWLLAIFIEHADELVDWDQGATFPVGVKPHYLVVAVVLFPVRLHMWHRLILLLFWTLFRYDIVNFCLVIVVHLVIVWPIPQVRVLSKLLSIGFSILINLLFEPFLIFSVRSEHEIAAYLLTRQDEGVDMSLTVPAVLGLCPPVHLWHFKMAQDPRENKLVFLRFNRHVLLFIREVPKARALW
jgi:hypothetical protein